MTSEPSDPPVTVTPDTKAAFLQYLEENPNNRRVPRDQAVRMLQWLTDADSKPESQKDSSRRNYVRKAFTWDENTRKLYACKKRGEEKSWEVITEDMIVDKVKLVHENNGHAGWDATWKEINSLYYGILRADVIFLLKRCQICATDPRKRPKNMSNTIHAPLPTDLESEPADPGESGESDELADPADQNSFFMLPDAELQ